MVVGLGYACFTTGLKNRVIATILILSSLAIVYVAAIEEPVYCGFGPDGVFDERLTVVVGCE